MNENQESIEEAASDLTTETTSDLTTEVTEELITKPIVLTTV